MDSTTYQARKGELETYFDRTASDAWRQLTSDAPVSKIRATVRAGRDDMRATLLSWLPKDLSNTRILDAGCGTGAFAIEAAHRGADVVAIDIAGSLVDVARKRAAPESHTGSIDFHVGDMLSPDLGEFDHVVAMDSLIHYAAPDIVDVLARFAERTRTSMIITFAPRTTALAAMHAVGKLFPRGDRAPAIQPVAEGHLNKLIASDARLSTWAWQRTHRVSSGFYKSQALEIVSTADSQQFASHDHLRRGAL